MSKRVWKIVQMAKSLPTIDSEIDHNNIENINLSSFSHASFLETEMNQVLSPEEVTELIESAEVVFDTNECMEISNNIETINPSCVSTNCLEYTLNTRNNIDNMAEINKKENLEDDVAVKTLIETREEEEEASNSSLKSDSDFIPESYFGSEESEEESDKDIDFSEKLNNGHPIGMEAEVKNIENKEEEEHVQEKLKRKKQGTKREINKRLRMSGQKYIGFRKPKGQNNTFHDKERQQRELKDRCKCIKKVPKKTKTDQTRKCYEITDEQRQDIFDRFWSEMTWEQRKIYVAHTVHATEKGRPSKNLENSRRSCTLKYNLSIGNKQMPVCKVMYLNTLNLGEWSVRQWTLDAKNGMAPSNETKLKQRPRRENIFETEKKDLSEFLESLSKLPSHYCRKDTDRLYLEQCFQSWTQLYQVYKDRCKEKGLKCLCYTVMKEMADEMKLSLFRPRKDQCDTCFQYKNGNFEEEKYIEHIERKDLARKEKEKDKEKALNGECNVITVDVQAVKLAPHIPASTLYYKQKLCCHNFTVYNLANNDVTCYWYNESEADGQASVYASFLVNYLEENFLLQMEMKPIIIYSDGCTAQNRNSILANGLLYLSEKYNVTIFQKFLEKGHTQMECDSVHSSIETALKNTEIYLPSDYIKITKKARSKNPYKVKNYDYTFFKNFGHKDCVKYSSIKPSKLSGDERVVVTDIRLLKYCDKKITCKLSYSQEQYNELLTRPKKIDLKDVEFPALYKSKLAITKKKYEHLQSIKKTIPRDCWSFYEQLPYQ